MAARAAHVELEMRAPGPGRAARKTAGSSAKALEAVRARLAVGADLAPVEFAFLLVVADDLIGRIDLGEALLGLRVGLIMIGMKFLGELPIGLLDLAGARRLGDAQNVIWIAHVFSLAHFRARPIGADADVS